MSTLARIRAFIGQQVDRLFDARILTTPGWRGRGLRLVQVLGFAGSDFRRNLCLERASTLSFVTIVSLIPVAVLFLSFLGQFWTSEQLKGFIETKLLAYVVPDADLRESLWGILSREIKATAFQFQVGVQVLAVVGLVVASAALLVTAERMFNRVWEVRLSRNYFQKLVIFWIILTTSPIILGGSLYFDQLTAQGTLLGTLKDRYWTFGLLYTFLVPALISFIAFTILNLVLPNTRVHLRAAVLGALVSAVLWEGAKKSFYLYVQETQKNARFYGSLGILPVFLFWIYVTWVIVLLGAEVTRAAQNLRQFVRLRRLRRGFPQPASPYLGVYLLDRIYSAFEAGAPLPSLEAVAEELDLVSEILEPVAKGLVENGILVPDGSRPGIFAPAKSSRSILLRDLVETLPENLLRLDELPVARAGGESGARVHRLFREARRAFLESFGSRTLGDLLEVSGGKAA